ncbi:GM25826 [Drosophila sechellia]|uniref:GM25826 n=1 Tax=Drosophila sechellia TaxID=7238 RepID=B4HEJ1_DROSE|nr:GM25826 [Drosophila sechellia]
MLPTGNRFPKNNGKIMPLIIINKSRDKSTNPAVESTTSLRFKAAKGKRFLLANGLDSGKTMRPVWTNICGSKPISCPFQLPTLHGSLKIQIFIKFIIYLVRITQNFFQNSKIRRKSLSEGKPLRCVTMP